MRKPWKAMVSIWQVRQTVYAALHLSNTPATEALRRLTMDLTHPAVGCQQRSGPASLCFPHVRPHAPGLVAVWKGCYSEGKSLVFRWINFLSDQLPLRSLNCCTWCRGSGRNGWLRVAFQKWPAIKLEQLNILCNSTFALLKPCIFRAYHSWKRFHYLLFSLSTKGQALSALGGIFLCHT